MLFAFLLTAVVGTAVYSHMDKPDIAKRVTQFKNRYFPVEADISDHIVRNTPFGFIPGHHPGKLEYANKAKPLIDKGEFYDKLNESQWGYAANLNSPAINTAGYQKILNDQFNIQEHPRLDITLQTPSKGRFRRSQYAYTSSD
jgi:hypothetical protein